MLAPPGVVIIPLGGCGVSSRMLAPPRVRIVPVVVGGEVGQVAVEGGTVRADQAGSTTGADVDPGAAAETSPLCAYLIVALVSGARTEELRALTWSHVVLEGDEDSDPPVLPHLMVWRSVRATGDTKTPKSPRSLAISGRCVEALKAHRAAQERQREFAGKRWQETDLVSATVVGTALDAANVRRGFRRVIRDAGLDPTEWTPRELRHSFVSLLSDKGVPIEKISLLVGHKGTRVTELVYRQRLRPVIQDGAEAMDSIFPSTGEPAE